jgi:hypothetical protein
MTDDAANRGTAYGPYRTATGKDGAANRTDSGADGGVLVLRRHSGTTAQDYQHHCNYRTTRYFLHCFHVIASFTIIRVRFLLRQEYGEYPPSSVC